jgi:hypothetical protein
MFNPFLTPFAFAFTHSLIMHGRVAHAKRSGLGGTNISLYEVQHWDFVRREK